MAKTKVSEWSSTASSNTDIDSINIAEGCAPSGINDAIRELMSQVKDFQAGTYGDSFNGPVGTSTAAAGAFTTLTASSTATLNTLASSGATLTGGSINNMAIGASTASSGAFTTLSASGAVTLSGGTANGVAYLNGSKVLTTGSALTFDGTNLGVGGKGTFSGAGSFEALELITSDANRVYVTGNSSASGDMWRVGTSTSNQNLNIDALQSTSNIVFRLGTTPTEGMRLTSTGLGIGTSSPSYKLHVSGAASTDANTELTGAQFVANGIAFRQRGNSAGISGVTYAKQIYASGSPDVMEIYNASNYPLVFGTNATERARIDSSGNLLVGTTSNPAGAKFIVGGGGANIYANQTSTGGYNYYSNAANSSGTYYHFAWYAAGTYVGEVRSSSTTTTYATASDYRLKEDIKPMTGALAKVAQLKPCTYKWKSDGSDGEGFIAHELQAVVPACVTGEKDAVDAEGKPVYQGIDTSFLAGLYAAAIQELKAELDSVKSELNTLKGN